MHAVHAAEPGSLKPLSHRVHVSFAPMLKVFSGHGTSEVRSELGLWPAVAIEQYTAALDEENSPEPSHAKHSAPSEEYLPG